MTHRDVVVVGASAGGVEALRALVAGLPPDLPAAILVVLHVPRESPSALPRILDRAGPLPARVAIDGELLTAGRIYVAPADHHLLVLGRRVRLSRGPSENGHRPAIDPLFRSAARAAGARVVAVVLSGSRDDGAAGAAAVAAVGGTVVVQDPEDALYSSMPRAAMARAGAQHVATAAKLGGLLGELTAESIGNPDPVDDPRLDAEVAIDDFADVTPEDAGGTSAVFGCPTCGGGLYEVESDPLPRYRCRVGHAWSPESLLEEQALATESALWIALRALEEKAALGRRMAGAWPDEAGRARFLGLAEDADNAGALIRELLSRMNGRDTDKD